jgi:hypothetical protein
VYVFAFHDECSFLKCIGLSCFVGAIIALMPPEITSGKWFSRLVLARDHIARDYVFSPAA